MITTQVTEAGIYQVDTDYTHRQTPEVAGVKPGGTTSSRPHTGVGGVADGHRPLPDDGFRVGEMDFLGSNEHQ